MKAVASRTNGGYPLFPSHLSFGSPFVIRHSFPPDGYPSRQPVVQFRPDVTHPPAAGPGRAAAALSGPQLLGGEGPGGPELLPLPGGRIRDLANAGRADQPGRDQGPLRGRFSAAKDHPRGIAAVPGDAAPQRAGGDRPARPGPATAQAPRRTGPQAMAGGRQQHPLHPLQRLRSGAAAELALSLRPLVFQPDHGGAVLRDGARRRCCWWRSSSTYFTRSCPSSTSSSTCTTPSCWPSCWA